MEKLGLHLMSAIYIMAGLNHFRAPRFYLAMMPPYIPFASKMVSISGICELLLGLMLLWSPTQSIAALFIILMLVVFFTVHIYMLQERNGKFKKVSNTLLILRIPLQFFLIYWAYQYV